MGTTPDSLAFEDVFRFRPPTPDEAGRAIGDFELKIASNIASAVGLEAFFSIKELREATKDTLGQTSHNMADEFKISPEDAHTMVLAGFLTAIELFAAIRLQTED